MAGETSGGSGTSMTTADAGPTGTTPVAPTGATPTPAAPDWVITDEALNLAAVDPGSPFGDALSANATLYAADAVGRATVQSDASAFHAPTPLPSNGSAYIAPITINAERGAVSLLVVDVSLGSSNKQTFAWRLDSRPEIGFQIYPLGAMGGAVQANVLRLLGTPTQSQQVIVDRDGVHALAQAVLTITNTQKQATHTPLTWQFALQPQLSLPPTSSTQTSAFQLAFALQGQIALPYTQVQTTPPPATFTVSYNVLVTVLDTACTVDFSSPDDRQKLYHFVYLNTGKSEFELVNGEQQLAALFGWAQGLSTVPKLRDAIRLGYVPIHLFGGASPPGTEQLNMLLSQKRSDAVRATLAGSSALPNSPAPSANTGGLLGGEQVKFQASATGRFLVTDADVQEIIAIFGSYNPVLDQNVLLFVDPIEARAGIARMAAAPQGVASS
jgi:hypothetical protein